MVSPQDEGSLSPPSDQEQAEPSDAAVIQVCGAVLGFVRTRDAELPPAPPPAQPETAPDEAGERPSGGSAAEEAPQRHGAEDAAPMEGWDADERALDHADAAGVSLEPMDTGEPIDTGGLAPPGEQQGQQNGALEGSALIAEDVQHAGLQNHSYQGRATEAQV